MGTAQTRLRCPHTQGKCTARSSPICCLPTTMGTQGIHCGDGGRGSRLVTTYTPITENWLHKPHSSPATELPCGAKNRTRRLIVTGDASSHCWNTVGDNVYSTLPSVFIRKGKNIHVCTGLYIPTVSPGWLPPRRGRGAREREGGHSTPPCNSFHMF